MYDRLYRFISLAYKDDKALPLKCDLGHAVYRALVDKNATISVDSYFADVSEHIHIAALDVARFVYVLAGFFTALIVAVGLWIAYIRPFGNFESASPTALGTLGGVIGATLSIFMRSNSLEISPYKQLSLSAFQGASRIALGALFGFVFVCCVKAEFLFGTALLSKPYGLFAISILAGFSETLVPELFRRLETEGGKAAAEATCPMVPDTKGTLRPHIQRETAEQDGMRRFAAPVLRVGLATPKTKPHPENRRGFIWRRPVRLRSEQALLIRALPCAQSPGRP